MPRVRFLVALDGMESVQVGMSVAVGLERIKILNVRSVYQGIPK